MTTLQHQDGHHARASPKTTWRRAVQKQRHKTGWKIWKVAKVVARDKKSQSDSREALCAYWRDDTYDNDTVFIDLPKAFDTVFHEGL